MPPPPSSFNPELSAAVDAVLVKGMAKDPKARRAACGEMVAALARALEASGAQSAAAAPSHTVLMPPPVPAARPAAPPPATFAPPAPAQSPVTGSFAPPPANVPELRYVMGRAGVSRVGARWRRRAFTALGVIGALVILGTAGGLVYAALQPSVSVSPTSANAGDQIQVTARNIPAGQQGTIDAFGNSQDFTAGGGGGVSLTVQIPGETPTGDYTVAACWDGSCHASASVHVSAVAALPIVSPSPLASPSSQATPLTLAVNPRAGIVPGRTVVTVTATGLAPGGARIGIAQGTSRQFWDALVGANGTLSKKIVLSATQPTWAAGNAFVTVCDVQYRCTAAVDVTLT